MRNPKYVKLINSWRWQKLRRQHLADHPLCEQCKKRGRVVAATEVHHITPVGSVSDEMGMERLAYDPANLMSLCSQCHKDIHDTMPRRHNKRLTKQQNKLLTSAKVAAFARFLPQQEEDNGNIQ